MTKQQEKQIESMRRTIRRLRVQREWDLLRLNDAKNDLFKVKAFSRKLWNFRQMRKDIRALEDRLWKRGEELTSLRAKDINQLEGVVSYWRKRCREAEAKCAALENASPNAVDNAQAPSSQITPSSGMSETHHRDEFRSER